MSSFNNIVVVASWGGGSTALTGFLHHCGAYTCPPHQLTDDVRTRNSFEPLAYAEALRTLFDEDRLQQVGDFTQFKTFFERFYRNEVTKAKRLGFEALALKHPLQTLVLPYLHQYLTPKYIFVTRPFEEIEATNLRRRWHPTLGKAGAKQIYSAATNFLISNSCLYLSVPYKALINDPTTAKKVLDFCELSPTLDKLDTATKFLKGNIRK